MAELNSKQNQTVQNGKRYDLEDRTLNFAKGVMMFTNKLPRSIPNQEVIRQVVRSAGSIGANYIEANESLSKKDFLMRVKICRKEAKETCYWLRILEENGALLQEASELTKIFGAIIEKSK